MEKQDVWYLKHLPMERQVFVDVGANVGRISQLFWDHSKRTSEIVSIEPVPENAKAIEARIRAAKAGNRWVLKKCAVSSRDGHVAMRPLRAEWGHNAMIPLDEGGERFQVACRRLEAIAKGATIVKVDVEGHEYAFLPQAVAAMTKVRAWALELHCVEGQRLEDTLKLLVDHGFRLIGAGQRRGDPDGPWVDVDVSPEWSWDVIPGVPSLRDGLPATFKMLHVIAKR